MGPVSKSQSHDPARSLGGTFGVVATLNEDPEQTRDFINYHLNLGANHIVVCFDNPADALIAEYASEGQVSCVPCTDRHWIRLLGRQPENMPEKQHSNLRYGVERLRALGVDWIISLDGDELLYCQGSVWKDLVSTATDVDLLLVRPYESILYDGMNYSRTFASEYFKVFPSPNSHAGPLIRKLYGDLEPLTRKGFFGHKEGKSMFRANAPIDVYRQHRPNSSTRSLNSATSTSMHILHFDCLSLSGWKRKWERRINGPTRATNISEKRQLQTDLIKTAIESGDDTLYEIFRKWHWWPRYKIDFAFSTGLLKRIEIPDAMFEKKRS